MNARCGHAAPSLGTLRLDAVYRAPSGRLCRLRPAPKHGPGSSGLTHLFEYLGGDRADGFRLTTANLVLLREVQR